MGRISLDPAVKAAIDQTIVLAQTKQWFDGEVAKGFVTPGGWKLGLTDSDVALLSGNFVLAKEAAALGMPLPPVVDMDGVPHGFESIEQLTSLMLAYGQRRADLSAEYAARTKEEMP